MTVEELEHEIEHVEKLANHNTDTRDVAGAIAKGVWQVALQLAKLNENTNGEAYRRALNAVELERLGVKR